MSFPLKLGSPETFATARDFLNQAGYTEQFLTRRFEIPSIHYLLYPLGEQGKTFERLYQGPGIKPLLARLFFGGYAIPQDELTSQIPANVMAAFEELGLIRKLEEMPGHFVCPVLLYPALGSLVCADRAFHLTEGLKGYLGKDYVMSGTENICRDYIESIPTEPCGPLLEIGTGSGLAALQAARFASGVWATDITPRAVAYAEFNARLNGADRMKVLQGDLFAPVAGQRFDRIVCNPPFEPPLKAGMIFSVGGEDGEAIMARLVKEMPPYLEPGGRLYMQVLGTDRETENFDARIRRWLGPASEEFDVALFVRKTYEPREYAIQQILGENDNSWRLEEWNLFYRKLRATSVQHGHAVLQRRRSNRPVFHVRRKFGPKTGLKQMEWLLDWETRTADPEYEETLWQSQPVPGPDWELEARHRLKDGKLAPFSYTLKNSYPFQSDLHVVPWIASLASKADGKRTAAEHFAWVRENGALTKEGDEREFLAALKALISSDFLRLPGMEP